MGGMDAIFDDLYPVSEVRPIGARPIALDLCFTLEEIEGKGGGCETAPQCFKP
jgi:hypothetical protein